MLFFVAVYVLVVMLHVFVNGHTQVDTNASPRSAHKQNQISDPPEHQRQDKRPYTPPSRHVRLSRGPSFGSSIHMPPQSNRNPTTTNAGEAMTRPLSPPAPPLPQNDHFFEGDLNRDTSHHHGERELTHLASSPVFSETFTNTHQHKAAKEVRKKVTTAHPERFQPRYHSESTDFGDRPVIIGICGGTGSGKTTLTNALYDRLGAEHVSCISHDSYYNDLQHLTLEERAHVNFDHPSSLDSNLMKDHINDLKEGKAIECPVYDFTTHSRKQDQTVRIEAKKIVLVDGILIFAEPKLLGKSIERIVLISSLINT